MNRYNNYSRHPRQLHRYSEMYTRDNVVDRSDLICENARRHHLNRDLDEANYRRRVARRRYLEGKDLTTTKGSFVKAILDDTTKAERDDMVKWPKQKIVDRITEIFEDNDINTPASNRMLKKLQNAKSSVDATFIIWNSIMAGADQRVI